MNNPAILDCCLSCCFQLDSVSDALRTWLVKEMGIEER